MPRLSRVCFIALFLFSVLISTSAQAAFQVVNQPPLQGTALVRALQEGGYVLYLRHAATEHIKVDRNLLQLDDCTTQRNLSEKGREQSRLIGESFKKIGISVAKVVSSPYCRCRDTAKIAFGGTEISNDLYFAIGVSKEETARLTVKLREMLTTKPPDGSNSVIVSHTANLKEAAGIWPKPEGVMAVFKPLEKGALAYFGMISPEEWLKLVDLAN